MNKYKKAKVYQAERVIAIGTGEAEGSVMVLATRFNQRVVVTITPEFMGELAKFAADFAADVPGAMPQPQPVVDATYDDDAAVSDLESEGGPAPEPQPEAKVIDLMAALKESLGDSGVATE